MHRLDCPERLDHPTILQSEGLLPMAYAEGHDHPSYPWPRMASTPACATALKTFVAENYEIRSAMEANNETVRLAPWRGEPLKRGGEIDKLASNIALARDAAGVHFGSDSAGGLKLGQEVVMGLRADYSRTYNEHFGGFAFTRFDGSRIRIANGVVQNR